jgi:hypothetical protein
MYLLLFKHQGSPVGENNLNEIFILYSATLAIDFMVLLNYTLHILIPVTNFDKFGWAFVWLYFLVPYISPILAFYSAMFADEKVLKIMGHMNSIQIMVNIPLTILFSALNDEDPMYYLVLMFMVLIKVAVNVLSGKVR